MSSVDDAKRAAGEAAVAREVGDGMCIGLGTGSTALWAIRAVAQRIQRGERITAVATSAATEALCVELGIPLVSLGSQPIEVAIDGADEVAQDWSLTKGGGGALFREKAVAIEARRFVVIVDDTKIVARLGAFPTPVEVVPFTAHVVAREIAATLGVDDITPRTRAGATFVTDNGNTILDCRFGTIEDPAALDARLRAIHGVVATGLFVGLTSDVIVAGASGVH